MYDDVTKDADIFLLDGRKIRFASKSSLIGWKENSDREKDRLDAMVLRELQENSKAFD